MGIVLNFNCVFSNAAAVVASAVPVKNRLGVLMPEDGLIIRKIIFHTAFYTGLQGKVKLAAIQHGINSFQ